MVFSNLIQIPYKEHGLHNNLHQTDVYVDFGWFVFTGESRDYVFECYVDLRAHVIDRV